MGARAFPNSYEEFLSLRREARAASIPGQATDLPSPTIDRRAEEAIAAIDTADEFVAARFGNEEPLTSLAYSLLVAAFILWGPQRGTQRS